jgi:hypothetical protein
MCANKRAVLVLMCTELDLVIMERVKKRIQAREYEACGTVPRAVSRFRTLEWDV